jgi:hypothetical protein
LSEIVVCAAAFMAGTLVGFLGAGPALFADGAMAEKLQILAATALIYAVLGVAVGALAPHMWKAGAISLVLPLFPIAALFGDHALSNSSMSMLMAGFILGDTAAALFGGLVGARLRLKRRPARAEQPVRSSSAPS